MRWILLMAIALVTHSIGVGTTSPAVDTSGANLIVLACTGIGSATPTDSKSNFWTPLTLKSGDFGDQAQLWYSVPTSVGSGHTFTDGDSFAAIAMQAFSGASASPFDQEAGSDSTVAGTQLPTVTPTQDGEVLVTCAGDTFAVSASIDGGFSVTDFVGVVAGVNFSQAMAYLIQTTAAAASPTWTPGSSTSGVPRVIATFKVAAAGGNTDTTWMVRQQRPMANFFPTIVNVP